jgi:FkbM family methyltransferase
MAASNDSEAIAAINDVWARKVYTRRGDDIQKTSTIIDIGAHIGSFSIFAATRAMQVKVYSYEPSEKNFHFLSENIKANKLVNIKAFQLAISSRRGKVRLYMNEKSSGNSIYKSGCSFDEVNSITLEDILGNNMIDSCDLLKIDCEGAEYEILLGAPKIILRKIRNIALEYHEIPAYNIDDLKNYLENSGFEVLLARQPILYAKNLT